MTYYELADRFWSNIMKTEKQDFIAIKRSFTIMRIKLCFLRDDNINQWLEFT